MSTLGPIVGQVVDCYFKFSENWIHTQIKHLEGWTPIVLTHRTKNLHRASAIPSYFARWEHLPTLVRKADTAVQRRIGFYPSYYGMARSKRTEVLHAHFGSTGYDMLPLAQALDVPLVTTFYGYDISQLPRQDSGWKRKYQELFEKGDFFLVEGPHLGNQLEQFGCPPDKIRVHHLGIELDQYPYQLPQKEPDEPLRILMAGRFTEKKGFPDGIKAFGQFIRSGGDGRLTVVGDSTGSKESDAVKREVREIVEARELEQRIDFRGFIPLDELRQLYYDHHVFLSPSVQAASGDNEGGAPVTFLEAHAAGRPIVATTHCDIPEVVQHGETGFLAPEHDCTALASHLKTLARDSSLVERMGQAGRLHVEANYNAELQGVRLGKLYEQVAFFRAAGKG